MGSGLALVERSARIAARQAALWAASVMFPPPPGDAEFSQSTAFQDAGPLWPLDRLATLPLLLAALVRRWA